MDHCEMILFRKQGHFSMLILGTLKINAGSVRTAQFSFVGKKSNRDKKKRKRKNMNKT